MSLPTGPAQRGLHSHGRASHLKGFPDEIIGSELEQLELSLRFGVSGQDDYRQPGGAGGSADLVKDLHAADAGHIQIEFHGVRLLHVVPAARCHS